jgi:hypothetical protein
MARKFTRAIPLCCTGLVAGMILLAGTGLTYADSAHKNSRADYREQGKSQDRGDRGARGNREERQGRDNRRRGGKHQDSGERRDRNNRRDRADRRDYRGSHKDRDRHYVPRKYDRYDTRVIYRGKSHAAPHHRTRWYRDVLVVRPYGHWYSGYAYHDHDDDAYKWLAFTAIALKLLDNLNEQQQREHEAAQVMATTAPVGETVIWQDGGASGAVTATREGTSTSGRYCREFLQEVSIGGRSEQAYGTACRQPDGSWEMISVDP